MPKRGGGHKAVESKRLAAAEHCKAKTVFFYKDGDDYFTVSEKINENILI